MSLALALCSSLQSSNPGFATDAEPVGKRYGIDANACVPKDRRDMSTVKFQFQDWLIEPDLNQLSRGESIKSLEPLAMSVLATLLEHSGEVVATETLLDQLWQGRSAEPGMVTRCVAQIRQALGR